MSFLFEAIISKIILNIFFQSQSFYTNQPFFGIFNKKTALEILIDLYNTKEACHFFVIELRLLHLTLAQQKNQAYLELKNISEN